MQTIKICVVQILQKYPFGCKNCRIVCKFFGCVYTDGISKHTKKKGKVNNYEKCIGIIIILVASILAAIDIGRMFNGLSHSWITILIGLAAAALSWIFLLESQHGFFANLVKSAGGIAAIAVIAVLLSGGDSPAAQPVNTSSNHPAGNYSYDYNYDDGYDDFDNDFWLDDDDFDDDFWLDDEPVTCFTCHGDGDCTSCGGSGECNYYSDTLGKYCRTCDGSGRCPGCNGRGTYD